MSSSQDRCHYFTNTLFFTNYNLIYLCQNLCYFLLTQDHVISHFFLPSFITLYASNFAHQKKRRGVVLRLRFSYIFSPDTGATLSALLKNYYETLPHIKCSHPCVQSFIICKAGHKLRMLYNPDPLYPYQMHSMQLVGKYLPPAHCAYIPEYEEWKPM